MFKINFSLHILEKKKCLMPDIIRHSPIYTYRSSIRLINSFCSGILLARNIV